MVRALFFVPGLRSELAKTCGHAHKEGQALPIKRGRPSPGFNTKSHSAVTYGIFLCPLRPSLWRLQVADTFGPIAEKHMREVDKWAGNKKDFWLIGAIVAYARNSSGLNHSVIAAVNGDLRAGRCDENIACDG